MRIRSVNLEVHATIMEKLVIIGRIILLSRKTKRMAITRNLESLEELILLGKVKVILQMMKAQVQVSNRTSFASWPTKRRRRM